MVQRSQSRNRESGSMSGMHLISCMTFTGGALLYNEPLTTSPVSIVLMVHVVKVVNTHIDAGASIAEMESNYKINFRLRVSMLQSKETNSTAQYSFRTSDRSWHDACYK